jgi:hypothetical protein
MFMHSGLVKWAQSYLTIEINKRGARGGVVDEALCYNPEGREVRDPVRSLNVFNLPNPSGRTKPWGLLNL